MKRSFVHVYKYVMACAVLMSIVLSTFDNLYAKDREQKTVKEFTKRNVSEITEEEKIELASKLLRKFATRSPRADGRAPRDDAPAFDEEGDSEIVGASLDSGTLKLIQQCLCIVKNCVGLIKKEITDIDHEEVWASLIDKIACSVIDSPDLPETIGDGQAQLAAALTEILCRIGCPIDPGTIFEFLNIIFLKVCTIDSKVDVIDNEIATIDSKVDVIHDKVCTIDSKVDVIDDEIATVDSKIDVIHDKVCTIDSKVDVIDNEIATVDSKVDVIHDKVCTIDSKVDVIDDEVATVDSKVDVIHDKVCTIDSKVDVIDDEVDLAVSKLCVIDSKIDELFIDFQETWTVIGANADPVPTPNAILDVNATTTYTVLQWLKAIYHKVK